MKLKKGFLLKLLAVATMWCPMFVFAENVQSADALLQKYAPAPEVKVVQPEVKEEVVGYTVQEIVKMLPIYVDDNGYFGSSPNEIRMRLNMDYYHRDQFINTVPNVPLPDAMIFDAKRVKAFNTANFGDCQEFYLSLSSVSLDDRRRIGDVAFFFYLRVLFNGGSRPQEDYVNATQIRLQRLQNQETFSSYWSACEEHEKYFVRFKEILDAVTQAAPTIIEQNKRIAQAIKDTKDKQNAEEQAQITARENARNACYKSNPYKVYRVSAVIVNFQNQIAGAQRAIEREKAGAKISGYVNKQTMYEKGNLIASLKASNVENFKYYKAAGGTAKNIEGVNEVSVDPCAAR